MDDNSIVRGFMKGGVRSDVSFSFPRFHPPGVHFSLLLLSSEILRDFIFLH